MKNIAILGSTGSIGTQALDVASMQNDINVTALSANSNVSLLSEQVRRYSPDAVCIGDKDKYSALKLELADVNVKIFAGTDNLSEISCHEKADMVLTSVVGNVGLVPTINAIKSKKKILLANKETLVTGGEIIMPLAAENEVDIIPVDSEHCAIFQSLQGSDKADIYKILLTCSGGPFYGKDTEYLKSVTVDSALSHPKWNMGAKITIDSSTLMNKGLEIIEAKWLFDVDIDDIEVYIHRQSIVHSMVEFCDGSVIAQLGVPDMRLPISYAVNYPERGGLVCDRLNLFEVGSLTFAKPDYNTFKCLQLAVKAAKDGGIMPTVMNGANEIAVDAFLNGKIDFLSIADIVEETMNRINNSEISADAILLSDRLSREVALDIINKL